MKQNSGAFLKYKVVRQIMSLNAIIRNFLNKFFFEVILNNPIILWKEFLITTHSLCKCAKLSMSCTIVHRRKTYNVTRIGSLKIHFDFRYSFLLKQKEFFLVNSNTVDLPELCYTRVFSQMIHTQLYWWLYVCVNGDHFGNGPYSITPPFVTKKFIPCTLFNLETKQEK